MTSSGDGTMPPMRQKKPTGYLSRMAHRTSSSIWPWLISTTETAFMFGASDSARSRSNGNGNSVIGRSMPSL